MITKINNNVVSLIQEAGQARYPNEACGFIVQKGKKTVAVEVENESPNPKHHFLINPKAYADVESEFGEIKAVWHTHTDEPPTPSNADKAGCEASEVTWFIMSVYKREDGAFEFSPLERLEPSGYEEPLYGRPYVQGSFDCYALVVDYLKRKHGIVISNDYERIDKFWLKGKPMFTDNYEKEGFVVVNDEPQDGDLILFQTDASGEASHIGVYVGDGNFLHHPQWRMSTVETYGGYWEKHTLFRIRHKSKC